MKELIIMKLFRDHQGFPKCKNILQNEQRIAIVMDFEGHDLFQIDWEIPAENKRFFAWRIAQ